MKLKRFLSLVLASTLVFTFAGCKSESSSTEDTTTEAVVTTKAPETPEEFHQAMIVRSLTSYGDVTRMQQKLTAAQNGEQINVCYLGGSITEGLNAGNDLCYAKLSCDYIAQKFGTGDNVNYINAGMSGTPSILGALRLDRDIIAYKPDILFVEFAVNDGTGAEFLEGLEGIIRTTLKQDNSPAVVLIFNRLENGYTAQDGMKRVGQYYNLPMISVADALTPEFDEGRMTWTDYSDDGSHPHVEGHALVTEMISYYFDTVMDQPAPETPSAFPQDPIQSKFLEGFKIYENTDLTATSLGGFKTGSQLGKWTKGWSNDTQNPSNDPIEFDITCKSLYMIYKTNKSANMGAIDLTISWGDGENESRTVTINSMTSDGWGNPIYQSLKMSAVENNYHITIKMAEGSEAKAFDILAFAYTE